MKVTALKGHNKQWTAATLTHIKAVSDQSFCLRAPAGRSGETVVPQPQFKQSLPSSCYT